MEGIIIEVKPEKYVVKLKNKEDVLATIRGSVKKKEKVLVGDIVEVKKEMDTFVIEKVHKKKNSLIRPAIANIDQMFCVVSKNYPEPDLNVLDKQIILCEKNNINPVICINKTDLEEENSKYKYIKDVYSKIGYTVIDVSAEKEIGLEEIKKLLANKISAFSGLSGVGKSSLMTKILDIKEEIEVGHLMKKINRGKHTTKYVKLYEVADGLLADTPGFSSLELLDGIEKDELKNYYPEFRMYTCKYLDCNHYLETEEECMVKKEVANQNIDKGRYDRYKKMYIDLEIKDKMKYKNKRRK